jgi:hypothetical protein
MVFFELNIISDTYLQIKTTYIDESELFLGQSEKKKERKIKEALIQAIIWGHIYTSYFLCSS